MNSPRTLKTDTFSNYNKCSTQQQKTNDSLAHTGQGFNLCSDMYFFLVISSYFKKIRPLKSKASLPIHIPPLIYSYFIYYLSFIYYWYFFFIILADLLTWCWTTCPITTNFWHNCLMVHHYSFQSASRHVPHKGHWTLHMKKLRQGQIFTRLVLSWVLWRDKKKRQSEDFCQISGKVKRGQNVIFT